MKSIKEVTGKLNNFFNNSKPNVLIPPNIRDYLKKVIISVSTHFSIWERGEDIEINESVENISDSFRKCNTSLFSFISEVPMTPEMKEFFENYSILLTNWAYNIKNQSNLKMDNLADETIQSMRALNRIINMHFTMLELINVSKIVCKFMNKLRFQYTPSIELSKQYLSMMDDKELLGNNGTEKCSSCDEKCEGISKEDKSTDIKAEKKEIIWVDKV